MNVDGQGAVQFTLLTRVVFLSCACHLLILLVHVDVEVVVVVVVAVMPGVLMAWGQLLA